MAFEETREQQQMYNYFRSCIYIFLIIEIVMNLPVTADNRVTQFILDLLARFKAFNSVSGCKVVELVCICIVCIGTKAKKALKFNVRTMVVYPVLAGLTLVGLCFVFHGMYFGVSWFGFPANRILYALCSVVGTMLVHQGLDGIAKYYNNKGRRPLQLRERVVPAVGGVGRQRLLGEHPYDILLEAEDAQGMDKHHQPLPWDNRVGNARFGQVLRCH